MLQYRICYYSTAIVLAVVLAIVSIGISLGVSSSSGTGGGDTGNSPVKDAVKRVAKWLQTLAEKSIAALPGIIGAIVSFILKTASAAVGFIAEHLWLFLVGFSLYIVDRR